MPHVATAVNEAVLEAAFEGLTATPKTLSPWLFYDEKGSLLFEQITDLPEYYLTRTERAIFSAHAGAMLIAASDEPLTFVELGAGTATKTGLLLSAAVRRQGAVLYSPIDVSASALNEAANLETSIQGLRVVPQVANYVTDSYQLDRTLGTRILALYIGSSIGNFMPAEARAVLTNLRTQLQPGDSLLLGTDLAPSANKSITSLLAAYDDANGTTAAFNKNVLTRLNNDLGSNFNPDCFAHKSRWNAAASRIEMHLESLVTQTVQLPGHAVRFMQGETIHTENSYKFTSASLRSLLQESGFTFTKTWHDPKDLFAVTLAHAL